MINFFHCQPFVPKFVGKNKSIDSISHIVKATMSAWLKFVGKICLGLFGFWKIIQIVQRILRGNVSKETQRVDLEGQIFCITGGNRGIGFETTKRLLNWGGFVILGVRDVKLCEEKLAKFFSNDERQRVLVASLDLSSFESVRNFVDENFIQPKRKLNCLINNAHHSGLAQIRSTPDHIEYSFQVNYLSHCLLTLLLIPILNSSKGSFPSRIVHVGSRTHAYGKVRRDCYAAKNRGLLSYDPNQIYPDTKLMQLLFSKSLTSYLQKFGCNISSNYVHPGGLVRTSEEWIRGPEFSFAMRFEPLLMKFAGTNVGDAATAVMKAATFSPQVLKSNQSIDIIDGNKYFDTTELKAISFDQWKEDEAWLWDNTLELIDLPINELFQKLSEK
jgi:NAD(P)-dependent dehydrogenase (short-subunit alcohol dehydrogenase family)